MPMRVRASSRASLRLLLLGSALGLVLCLKLPDAIASNLDFLRTSPISYFNEDDKKLMMDNARSVLDSQASAAKSGWSNPKTGSSGEAQVTDQFTSAQGTLCKHLRIVNRTRTLNSDATYTVCRDPQRGWVLSADSKPAGS
jgi:hypothetical protein